MMAGRLGIQANTAEGLWRPVVYRYYSHAITPQLSFSFRNMRELETIIKVTNCILRAPGSPPPPIWTALDILMQRAKALEAAQMEGTWDWARWMELVQPEEMVSLAITDSQQAQTAQSQWNRARGKGGRGTGRAGGWLASGSTGGQWQAGKGRGKGQSWGSGGQAWQSQNQRPFVPNQYQQGQFQQQQQQQQAFRGKGGRGQG